MLLQLSIIIKNSLEKFLTHFSQNSIFFKSVHNITFTIFIRFIWNFYKIFFNTKKYIGFFLEILKTFLQLIFLYVNFKAKMHFFAKQNNFWFITVIYLFKKIPKLRYYFRALGVI